MACPETLTQAMLDSGAVAQPNLAPPAGDVLFNARNHRYLVVGSARRVSETTWVIEVEPLNQLQPNR